MNQLIHFSLYLSVSTTCDKIENNYSIIKTHLNVTKERLMTLVKTDVACNHQITKSLVGKIFSWTFAKRSKEKQ
jgi:hypothetical protein